MNDLISQLKKYALEDYPIPLVTEFLNDYKLPDQELKNYLHFKDNKYARNLVYKDKDFEILIVCWHPEQIAPIHGHEGEKCWMRVEAGSLNIFHLHAHELELFALDANRQLIFQNPYPYKRGFAHTYYP
jgi:predicted metal-dependent enzyme (double-stranded beta helix superfamily)